MVRDEDVEFIRLQFTDMFGTLKNIAVTARELPRALKNQCMVDGSQIAGVREGKVTDMYLYPDPDTFTILPWRPQQGKVARMLCDLYRPDGKPYISSSRYILKKVTEEAGEKGYTCYVDPECEFFLFHSDDNGIPTTVTHEQAGYLDMSPLDLGENARRDMVLSLEDMGIEVESSHHETAPAQHEIDFRYGEIREMADRIMTFKMAVRSIAKRHGLHATFMPKPVAGVNGSGMHVNMALCKDGKNVFEDPEDELGLSREAYAFIAGIFAHIKGMTALFNPLVNSYKRLVPGFEAPSDITWSSSQRTAMVKVPGDRRKERVVELRSPDPSADPYLVFALCLAAGLEGIEKGMELAPELKADIRSLSEDEKKELGIRSLPENLNEALNEMEQDAWIAQTLGGSFAEHYRKNKRSEWKDYSRQVSDWELSRYLYRI